MTLQVSLQDSHPCSVLVENLIPTNTGSQGVEYFIYVPLKEKIKFQRPLTKFGGPP